MLKINNLHVEAEGKEILKGVNLEVNSGQLIALMGPNGSGKSTLASVIMGNKEYKITKGSILYNGENIENFSPDERAKKGIFLSFQHPVEIQGVTFRNFLKEAYRNVNQNFKLGDFIKILKEKSNLLSLSEDFLERYINVDFSGGEKKKAEILQLLVLNPKLAILDETDSGLDIDALKIVSNGINKFRNDKNSVLLITHYKRILEYVKPDKIFVIIDGTIVMEGPGELINQLEEKGYGWISK